MEGWGEGRKETGHYGQEGRIPRELKSERERKKKREKRE